MIFSEDVPNKYADHIQINSFSIVCTLFAVSETNLVAKMRSKWICVTLSSTTALVFTKFDSFANFCIENVESTLLIR